MLVSLITVHYFFGLTSSTTQKDSDKEKTEFFSQRTTDRRVNPPIQTNKEPDELFFYLKILVDKATKEEIEPKDSKVIDRFLVLENCFFICEGNIRLLVFAIYLREQNQQYQANANDSSDRQLSEYKDSEVDLLEAEITAKYDELFTKIIRPKTSSLVFSVKFNTPVGLTRQREIFKTIRDYIANVDGSFDKFQKVFSETRKFYQSLDILAKRIILEAQRQELMKSSLSLIEDKLSKEEYESGNS